MDQEPVEADLGSEVQVVWDQDRAGQGSEVPVVWAQDQAAVHKRSALGPELATTAARLLFREWSPVLLVEPLVGAASRQTKSFSGFSEH